MQKNHFTLQSGIVGKTPSFQATAGRDCTTLSTTHRAMCSPETPTYMHRHNIIRIGTQLQPASSLVLGRPSTKATVDVMHT